MCGPSRALADGVGDAISRRARAVAGLLCADVRDGRVAGGGWLLFGVPLFVGAVILRRSAVGRGFLWTFGRGKSPRTTVIVLGIAALVMTVVTTVLHIRQR